MDIEALLDSCFDPLICNCAVVTIGKSAGKEFLGIYDDKERSVPMGRTKIPSGFGAFATRTKEVSNIEVNDEIRIKSRTFSVYSIEDDMFGMSILTLMEIVSGN